MKNTPMIEPFFLQFDRDGQRFAARITYAKSSGSCQNIFEVDMMQPQSHPSFTLREQTIKSDEGNFTVWVDQEGREKEFYQLVGSEIGQYMKDQLGIFLLDTPLDDNQTDRGTY